MQIRKLKRCPSAKYSFVITMEAYEMFALVERLQELLGTTQYPPVDVPVGEKDERPWWFVFVKDSTEGAERFSWRPYTDGRVHLRLYINDEAIAVQFLLMTDTTK